MVGIACGELRERLNQSLRAVGAAAIDRGGSLDLQLLRSHQAAKGVVDSFSPEIILGTENSNESADAQFWQSRRSSVTKHRQIRLVQTRSTPPPGSLVLFQDRPRQRPSQLLLFRAAVETRFFGFDRLLTAIITPHSVHVLRCELFLIDRSDRKLYKSKRSQRQSITPSRANTGDPMSS